MKLEQRALLIHILVNILLIIAKVIIGVFFHVYLLVVDAIYTGSDFLFNILTWIGIKIGNKKACKKYPYGYGKIFYVVLLIINLISIIVGIVILVLSFFIEYQVSSIWIVFFLLVFIIIKFGSAHYLYVVAKKRENDLLLSSSVISKMEVYSTILLIFILFLNQFFPMFNMIGSIFIASILIIQSFLSIIKNSCMLLGTLEDDTVLEEKVLQAVDKYKVINISDIKFIKIGSYYQVILKVKVNKNIKVRELLNIENKIKKELKKYRFKFIHFQLL